MTVLIFEDNLMWGPRLRLSVSALEHEPVVFSRMPDAIPEADAAIVNLGSTVFPAADLVPLLRGRGIYVIAHAGHKEKELHELGRTIQCDRLATNSELTHKIPDILREVTELNR